MYLVLESSIQIGTWKKHTLFYSTQNIQALAKGFMNDGEVLIYAELILYEAYSGTALLYLGYTSNDVLS